MKNYGDITKINGSDVEITDVVIGGSPCQDLSIAGLRKGLEGERSGLFMEQIRLIKEMRNECRKQLSSNESDGVAAEQIRPRYMVWENVCGAFSSNGGEDFRAVLEETVKVADENAYVPGLAKGQKWANAGCIMGDGYSVAWRVHDAQYWGVPQRRRRVCVLADYGGGTAPEILFELLGESEYPEAVKTVADLDSQSQSEVQAVTESVSGYSEPCGTQRQGVATFTENGIGTAISFQERAGKPGGGKGILIQNEHTGALSTLNNQAVVYSLQGSMIGREDKNGPQGDGVNEDVSFTLNTTDRHVVCYGMDNERRRGADEFKDVSPALTARAGTGGNNVPVIMEPYTSSKAWHFTHLQNDGKSECLAASDFKDAPAILMDCDTYQDIAGTLDCCICKGTSNQLATSDMFISNGKIVRRMTPFECGRLQGYPDGWMDIGEWVDEKGKLHKEADAPKYKALGNSIALPFWYWLLKNISAQYPDRKPTMASLFDGIGGFPLCWQWINGDGTCVWSSEIEPFPIAVTEKHFGENGDWQNYEKPDWYKKWESNT